MFVFSTYSDAFGQDPFVPNKTLQQGENQGQKIDTEENNLRAIEVATAGQMQSFFGIKIKPDEIAIANISIGDAFYVAVVKDKKIESVDAISSHVMDVGPFEMRHSALRYNFDQDVLLIPQDKSLGLNPLTTDSLTLTVFRVGDEANEANGGKKGSTPSQTLNNSQALIFMGFTKDSYYQMQLGSQKESYSKNLDASKDVFIFDPPLKVRLEVNSETKTNILHMNIRDSYRLSYKAPYHLFYSNCHTATCGLLGRLPQNKSHCGQIRGFMGKMNPSRLMDYLKSRGLVSSAARWSPI